MIHRAVFSSRSLRAVTALAVAALVVLIDPPRASMRRPSPTMFKRAQAQRSRPRRRPIRRSWTLRRAANAYEAIVRRYPSSSYSDNALWQAAALLERAYSKSGAATDLDKAVKLLAWLRREYPASKHASAAGTKLAALQPSAPATAGPAAPPLAATPAAPAPAPAGAPPVRRQSPSAIGAVASDAADAHDGATRASSWRCRVGP